MSCVKRPVLLDFYCKAGGAAKGYQEAGFFVIGVDHDPQPNYAGDEFIQADVLGVLGRLIGGCWIATQPGRAIQLAAVAAVHASPPCQNSSDLRHRTGGEYPELIPETRELLRATGLPYVIENVEGSALIDPVRICGASIDGLRVIRHRMFESNIPLVGIDCPERHPLVFTYDKRKGHYGQLDQDTSYVQVTGGGNCTIANKRAAMGVEWMTGVEANEAIPPAYARHIGLQLRAAQGIQVTVDDCIADAEGAGL